MVSPPQSPKLAAAKDDSKSPTPDPTSPSLPGSAIEPAIDDGEEDEFEADELGARTIVTTSATSSIYAHTFEHGRRYQFFKNSRYPIPNDDLEQDREDMKHAMLLELTDGRLFFAPVGDHPQLIVDVGTGTGESSVFQVVQDARINALFVLMRLTCGGRRQVYGQLKVRPTQRRMIAALYVNNT